MVTYYWQIIKAINAKIQNQISVNYLNSTPTYPSTRNRFEYITSANYIKVTYTNLPLFKQKKEMVSTQCIN